MTERRSNDSSSAGTNAGAAGDEGSRIRSLVEEALNSERTPEDVCATHPELLDAVRVRYARIQELAGELDRAFPSSGPVEPRRVRESAGDRTRLPRVPGYELESMLGRGGMGVVYRAQHLKLGRPVALKMLLRGDDATAKELERLLLEARTVAGLHHPHIVEVHDAGEAEGQPYFTMELVEGGSLADALRGVPMRPRDAAVLVRSLAAAIQVAHDEGVVHRDLKPGNVLVTRDGVPKISDFGLARRVNSDTRPTTAAAHFGTPSYMAPEQARGTPAAFDRAVDVYALGAILYETLTGRPPFRANSPIETQRQVIHEDPVAPSRINPSVPRDLETICLKCLRKNPVSRYASAADLQADLGRFLDGLPILARKTGTLVRAAKWARRHPTATTALGFASLGIAAVIVAVAGTIATASSTRRVVESDLAEVESAQRSSQWAAADLAIARASLRLGADGPLDLRARVDAARRNGEIVERLEAIRMTRALATGSQDAFVASDQAYADAYRAACDVGDEASPQESARRIEASPIGAALTAAMYDWHLFAVDPRRRDWMLAVLRIVDSDAGGWRDRARDPAIAKDRDAVARLVAEASLDGHSPAFLMWFAMLVRNTGGDPTPILRHVQSAHPDDFWANFMLATVLHQRGQTAEAMRFMQGAIATRPDVAIAHGYVGNYLRALDRLDESLEQLEIAVRLDPVAPILRGNLAHTLMAMGRATEALPHVELAVARSPQFVAFRVHLGHAHLALGRDDDAIEQFTQAAKLGANSATLRESLLTGFIRAGRGAEAIAAFRSSIPQESRSYEHWDGLLELCRFVGANDDYAASRASLLATFGTSEDPVVCERLCRGAMLAPIDASERGVALAAIDRALAAEANAPTWRNPLLRLAKAMACMRGGESETALGLLDAEVDAALEPMPQLVAALALADLGRNDEARAALAHAATFGDWRIVAASAPESWICHALRREAEAKLLPDLDAFLAGTFWPSATDERLAMIATCEDRGLAFAAARLFAEAFDADPALERRIKNQCRYRAAVAAAACGCGAARDGQVLTVDERSAWRTRCLRWLREELAALPAGTVAEDRIALLTKWRTDRDLRVVRDPVSLAELPESERAAFTQLWKDVDAEFRSLAD